MVFSLDIPLAWHLSPDPKSGERPTIIFVHNYGGNVNTTRHHARLVEDLGFSSVSFSLSNHGEKPRWALPFNLVKKWADDTYRVINQLDKNQKKIIFAFSGPSASALDALVRRLRNGKKDVVALICDSGPFTDVWGCTRQMVKRVLKIKNPYLVELKLAWLVWSWGIHHDENLLSTVRRLGRVDPEFPILSIRGIKDPIVPPQNIEEVFQGESLENLKVHVFGGGHLTSLREFPQEYERVLREFLEPWT